MAHAALCPLLGPAGGSASRDLPHNHAQPQRDTCGGADLRQSAAAEWMCWPGVSVCRDSTFPCRRSPPRPKSRETGRPHGFERGRPPRHELDLERGLVEEEGEAGCHGGSGFGGGGGQGGGPGVVDDVEDSAGQEGAGRQALCINIGGAGGDGGDQEVWGGGGGVGEGGEGGFYGEAAGGGEEGGGAGGVAGRDGDLGDAEGAGGGEGGAGGGA